MKTDPEHADYTVEQGATRNFEPWREKDRWVEWCWNRLHADTGLQGSSLSEQ